jgi:2-hydroxychromene-2-carboxylate isomerase
MTKSKLTFWYDLASTYSYLSAMRVEALAEVEGVEVVWRPFLLGPIFVAQGWASSPFNLYPAKGAYMVRDIDRIASLRELPFVMPKVFPSNSLTAARVALVGAEDGWIAPFTRAVYAAQFGAGQDIADPAVLASLLDDIGQDAGRALARATQPAVKDRLKDNTEVAQSLGIFGAPSFTADDDELFWGDDRLEQAVAWATQA